MIAKVVHGWRPAGLLRYLFGPGKHEEHQNPHVVASWDGAPWLHNPVKLPAVELEGERIEPGPFDLNLGPLTTTMQELAELAGLPVTNPPPISPEWADWLRSGRPLPFNAPSWVRQYRYDRRTQTVLPRRGYVWHCPVRLHPDDRTLTDEEWQHIAERLMRATGIQQAGCRWIAVRHAEDHIHLVATLVSEDTGKRFHPRNDYYALRDECRALEREYGLVATAPADRTALRVPTRAERGKAARTGWRETAREELREVVAQAAAAAHDGGEFLTRLAAERIRVRPVRDTNDVVRGYVVALPGDLTAAARPVWYSGSRLGRDLTWPKLEQRWRDVPATDPDGSADSVGALKAASTDAEQGDPVALLAVGTAPMSPTQRRAVLQDATEAVQHAIASVRAEQNVEGIAHAAGEVLVVLTRGQEGGAGGSLSEVSQCYDRATRTPYRVLPRSLGPVATELRRASRRVARLGALSGHGHEKFATAALLLALAGLIAEIAAWQQMRGRIHQAVAARSAAGALPNLAVPAGIGHRSAVTSPTPNGTLQGRPAVRRNVAAGQQRLARPQIGGLGPAGDPSQGRSR